MPTRKAIVISYWRNDLAGAEDYFRQSYAIAEKLEDKISLGAILDYLGELAWRRGDIEQAHTDYQSSFHYADDEISEGIFLITLGDLWQGQGDLALARAKYKEAQAIQDRLHSPYLESRLRKSPGDLDREYGNFAAAEAAL